MAAEGGPIDFISQPLDPLLPLLSVHLHWTKNKTAADPDFSRRGSPTFYLPKICRNCMEMKKIGPGRRGMRPKFYYVDPPLQDTEKSLICQ